MWIIPHLFLIKSPFDLPPYPVVKGSTMPRTRSSKNLTASTPPIPETPPTLDYIWWIKVILCFGIWTLVVVATTKDKEIGFPKEKGLVSRFILTISYAFGPVCIGMCYVDTRRTSASFFFMQVSLRRTIVSILMNLYSAFRLLPLQTPHLLNRVYPFNYPNILQYPPNSPLPPPPRWRHA